MAKYKSNYNKKSNNYYRKNNNKNKTNNSLNSTGRLNLNDLETTTRIRIDDARLNDTNSLDTSFLEGRFSKNKKKIIKDTKINNKYNNFNNNRNNNKEDVIPKKSNKGAYFVLFIIIVVTIGLIGFALFSLYNIIKSDSKTDVKVVTKNVINIRNDENIVFLGDSITDGYDLEKYYKDYHVVNSGISGNKTYDILDDMENRVYKYNPSKVFLLIGVNDLAELKDDEDEFYKRTYNNIKKIIENIKENRKYAEIYLESIYPINDSDDDKILHDSVDGRNNRLIKNINKKLEKLASKENITYIDLYSILKDKDDNIKLEYTIEGLHISEEGYKVITKELLKYINDEK